MAVYGYARVSTPMQNIDRQVRNIKAAYPNVEKIYKEVYTGTEFQLRKELQKLLKRVIPGDVIIFDAVSRMSRDAEDGFKTYETLFNHGIELIFLKEPHINSNTYREALKSQNIAFTGDAKVNFIIDGINKYLMALAKEQIRIAFEQAEKEVMDLRQRTREGMFTAKLLGKQIGQEEGRKLEVKKEKKSKAYILQYSKEFGGQLSDKALIELCGISRKTFYKYKKELKEQQA